VRLTEEELRKITVSAIEELGDKATPENVKQVVSKAVEKYGAEEKMPDQSGKDSGRIILTSFGMNKPGVVASITSAFSEANCDIQDISQKLMGEFYTMIMIIDITNSPKDLSGIQEDMNKVADELKIKIYLQHEDVFRSMHRI
jgi:ACT domain-containing protein